MATDERRHALPEAVSSGLPEASLDRSAYKQIHPDEQRAALWLRANSAPDDVVASNTACRPARRQPPCDDRGYSVNDIAARHTVLEGWAYTEQVLAEQCVNGLSYRSRPSPWPGRAGIIRRLFSSPTREIVETLRTTYGVRWTDADQLAGRIPVKTLGKLAVLRHEVPSGCRSTSWSTPPSLWRPRATRPARRSSPHSRPYGQRYLNS
jgi:hypothetical protein